MLINPESGSNYFTIFYSLAFFFVFLWLLWEGYKRKIPTIAWVLLLIFARVCFIVGTKIFTYSQDQWLLMIQTTTLIPTSEKILFGGMLLGLISLMIGKYVLRIKQNILDAFAIILPLGIGIQRIGCFFNGCCFGTPTSMPWGVQYPINTPAHFVHYQEGLIGQNDLLSLSIHPVQLYEMAGALVVAFIVVRSRKLWKANGSLFTFSLLLYSLIRFMAEFFRDNVAHTIGGEMVGVFNQVQWAMLFTITVLSIVLYYREKKVPINIPSPSQTQTIGIKFNMFIFISESLLIWTLRNWFSPAELIAIILTFLASGIIIFILILKEIASSEKKMIYAFLLLLPFLITSQTIINTQADTTLVVKTRKISFGIVTGTVENSVRQMTGTSSETGCGTYNLYRTENFKQKYTMGGASISVKTDYPEKKYSTSYGVNMYVGQNREYLLSKSSMTNTTLSNSTVTNSLLLGINPFFKIDGKWIGAGVGIHAGNLLYPKQDGSIHADSTTAMNSTSVFPQVYFRIGPQRILFVDYHLADQFPTPFPGFYQQLGIGSGFGSKGGTIFRAGSLIDPKLGAYLSVYMPVNKDLSFEPLLVFTGSSITHFSFGIQYNLSTKTNNHKIRQD